MAKAADIVQKFMGALGKGDFVAVRKYLDAAIRIVFDARPFAAMFAK